MKKYTEYRNGRNVIPLRNAICGVNMPHWKLVRANDNESFLIGDAVDMLAAYENAETHECQGIFVQDMKMPISCMDCPLNYGEKRPEKGLTVLCQYSDGVKKWNNRNGGRLEFCRLGYFAPSGSSDMPSSDGERMTERLADGQAVMNCSNCELNDNGCNLLACRNRLKDRLAAYEDAEEPPLIDLALQKVNLEREMNFVEGDQAEEAGDGE